MTEYNFFAIAKVEGGSISDRYRIDADTFSDACIEAQELEPELLYTEFVQVVNHE